MFQVTCIVGLERFNQPPVLILKFLQLVEDFVVSHGLYFSAFAKRALFRRFSGLGPRRNECRLDSRKAVGVANQLGIFQAFPENPLHRGEETAKIALLVLTLVEPENLLAEIPKQVERLNGNIGSVLI